MATPQPLPSRLIGALFVERGLVSESQIRVALELQNETGQQLGQILVERFGVSRRELASVVAEQWAKLGGSSGPEDNASWRRLGEIFVDRGFVTQEELENALKRQRQTGERLGEALVAQGVISKFELAGALAEQMAALGDAGATDEEEAPAQAEATIHQFPSRDVDVPFGAVAETAEPDVGEPEGVVEELRKPDVGEPAGLVEELGPPDVGEPEGVVDEASEPDVGEPEGAVDEVRPHDVGEPEDGAAVSMDATEDEPAAVEAVAAGPEAEHAAAEASADPPAEPEPESEPVTVPDAPIVEEPEPIRYSFDYLPEEDDADAAVANGTAVGDPAIACLAFAPTTVGYRLVELDAIPSAGERIDVPDVGERIVLRVGASPLPHDDRLCAYLEEPVTSVPA